MDTLVFVVGLLVTFAAVLSFLLPRKSVRTNKSQNSWFTDLRARHSWFADLRARRSVDVSVRNTRPSNEGHKDARPASTRQETKDQEVRE